jgi:DNA-binding response OmpR family regulator
MPRATVPGAPVLLVIEDDTDTRQAIGENLTAMFPAARVLMSESGEAGLELARRTRPRVVLLDLRLRGIHGFEFAERLRSSRTADGVAIVALTGDMSPDTLMKAEAAGFTAFLRKPADMDRLEAVLRPLLDPGHGPDPAGAEEPPRWNRSRGASPS